MEYKDWITLFTPIICNGIIVFALQEIFSRKFERYNKRQDIRNEVLKRFWNKLQELNGTFIQVNTAVMRNPEVASNSAGIFQNSVLDIIQYYDTNQFDLEIFSKEYVNFQQSWNDFERIYKMYAGKQLDRQKQLELGRALQLVKEKNQELINEVRRQY